MSVLCTVSQLHPDSLCNGHINHGRDNGNVPEEHWTTYKPPTAKIPISACFCFRGRLSLLITGIGNRMIAKSVKIFMPPLMNHTAY